MAKGNHNPKRSWATKEARDAMLGENKAYSLRNNRLTDESRQKAMNFLAEKITTERDLVYFADIFNGTPLTDSSVSKILGLNERTLTAARLNRKKDKKKASIRTTFAYRALKHLKPEIIYFLLSDKYFDNKDELLREFKEAFNSINEVKSLEIGDEMGDEGEY